MSTAAVATPAQIGPRFQLISAVPTAVCALVICSLVIAGAPGETPNLDRWTENLRHLGVLGGVALVATVVVLGLVFHPFQYSLVQALEGYWPARGPLSGLTATCIRRQFEQRDLLHRRRSRLNDLASRLETDSPEGVTCRLQLSLADRRLRDYPDHDVRMLPTKLGNVLRAREDLAGRRYSLDAISTIPRLYPLMSDVQRSMIEDARGQLDLFARFSATWIVSAVVSSVLLLDSFWWNLFPLVLYLLSYLSYRGATAAARSYGDMLARAIDLYRLELLKQVAFPPPRDLEHEGALFKAYWQLASGERYEREQAGLGVLELPPWHHDEWGRRE